MSGQRRATVGIWVSLSVLLLLNSSFLKASSKAPLASPQIYQFAYAKQGDQITLSWRLSAPGDQVVVFRGKTPLASLGGNATNYGFTEQDLGLFRYTVILYHRNQEADRESALIDLGSFEFSPSKGPVSGYFLYIAEAKGSPKTALPYHNPSSYSVDVNRLTQIPLKELLFYAYIKPDVAYYITCSSYLLRYNDLLISELGEAITFTFRVDISIP